MSTFLTTRERERYSIRAAINASCDRGPAESCFEKEISDSAYKRLGLAPTGGSILVPPDIVFGGLQDRALSVGTFNAGGAAVGTSVRSLIQYVFGQSVALQLGATVIQGQSGGNFGPRGAVTVPIVTSASAAQWVAELQAPTDGSAATGVASASGKRIATKQTFTNQLLAQTESDLVERILGAAIAAGIEKAALSGSGGVEPLGLLNNPDVGTVSLGTNGGTPTLAALCDAERKVANARLAYTSPGWVTSPGARYTLKQTPKAAGNSCYLLETDGAIDRVNGFTGYQSAFLPDTLTKGSGTNLGSAIFGGAWEWLLVCWWGGIEVVGDKYTQALSGKTIVVADAHADVMTPRPSAFTRIVDMVPAA